MSEIITNIFKKHAGKDRRRLFKLLIEFTDLSESPAEQKKKAKLILDECYWEIWTDEELNWGLDRYEIEEELRKATGIKFDDDDEAYDYKQEMLEKWRGKSKAPPKLQVVKDDAV